MKAHTRLYFIWEKMYISRLLKNYILQHWITINHNNLIDQKQPQNIVTLLPEIQKYTFYKEIGYQGQWCNFTIAIIWFYSIDCPQTGFTFTGNCPGGGVLGRWKGWGGATRIPKP